MHIRNVWRVIVAMIATSLVACSDGVPHVDDPHHPVDSHGSPIKGTEFVQRYCQGKASHPTCVAVQQAVSQDSVKGGVPKGW